MKGLRLPRVEQELGEKMQMSLSGLRPTRIDADRVISTFLFDLAASRAHRIPIEGESVGRRVKEQRNATRGLCRPYHERRG